MDDVTELLGDLNADQREAVSAPVTSLLVLAGAGSGKTRVLVHRIAWLIKVENISPYSLLAVTFTNKAAAEMRGRIEELMKVPATGMWVGTFHGLAHRLLRRHWQEAKLPQNFQILDSDDQLRMVKRIIRGLELDETRWPPRQAQWFINARKDEGVRPQSMEDTGDSVNRQLIRIYSAYQAACERAGAVDFAELLLRSLEVIRDNRHLLAHYQERFRHILVDEFQDTNTLQYSWLKLIAGGKTPVFAVGDDDQSIYGWRGAKIEHIQQFSQDFPNSQMVRLEQNYRSTGNILSAANALITNNNGRMGKNLWTDDSDGELVKLYTAVDEYDEARYVAGRIRGWEEDGNPRAEIAVLYRSNAQSRVFEEIFNTMQIPYRVYGGLRFFERAEIKDALAYLRLTSNSNEDSSFERVVNQPPRGIGSRTLEIIRDAARTNELSMYRAASQLVEAGALSGRAANAVRAFFKLIEDLKTATHKLSLHESVEQINEASGLRDHYAKEKGEKAQTRLENLDELVTAARGFVYDKDVADDEEPDMNPLDAFLAYAVLESGEGQGDAWEDCVQMMTLHSSKGLEFPLVFLVGMEEGLFPHQMSLEEPGRLEEERRLCYVGITRARKQLVLSCAERRRLHGTERYNLQSQFIGEIPEALLEQVRPKAPASSYSYSPPRYVTKPATAPALGGGLRVGDQVHHAKFGDGVITNHEGQGSSTRVEVNFKTHGSKWLVLAYAKLDKC